MASRGSYAKGVAKRDEILRTALDVVAARGMGGTSVKELADAVGLSQAGLLHYFDSKDDLFVQILRARDEADTQRISGRSLAELAETAPDDPEQALAGFVEVVRHNAEVPGMVELFSRMSVEAANPDSPARAYFVDRNRTIVDAYAPVLELLARPADDRNAEGIDPRLLATLLQAVSDGLQLRSLAQPDLDITEAVKAFLHLLAPGVHLDEEPQRG